jgi:LPS-assembly protein
VLAPTALLLATALAQFPLATETELPTGERVVLAADQLLYEPSRQLLIARGHTVLRTEQATVRAEEVTYDQLNERAVARGNVMLVSGLFAAVADEVRLDVRTLEAEVDGGLFLKKRDVTPEQLLAARTADELKRVGQTVLTLTGRRIKRIGPNEFLVDGLSFNPCDCDPNEPTWRIEARRAEVQIGERAILTSPIVYVQSVPVLWLPWVYLPLADRRTGLLLPKPNVTALNGLTLEQPVFVTLGESYDATFTPGYYLGGSDPKFGVRGPRLHTEFRYAPSPGTGGRATAGLLYDLRPRRHPFVPEEAAQPAVKRGLRAEGSWQHSQELGRDVFAKVDGVLVSDGYLPRDATADIVLRQNQYLRSTATVFHRGAWTFAGLDAVLRQAIYSDDQRFGFELFRQNQDAVGAPLVAPRTLQRLPAATFAIPERSLWGPVAGGVRVEFARLAPLGRAFGDEGTDGLFHPLDPDPDGTQGNGRLDPGEREARDRLDLRPQLSARLPLLGVAQLTPYAGWRQDLYFGEVTSAVAHRGYPILGASLESALRRDFAAGPGLRHWIRPSLELRSVPWVFGGLPGRAYDEVDLAVPPEGFTQAVAQVRQELALLGEGGYRPLVRLDLGQGLDLQEQVLADAFARFSLWYGPAFLGALTRYDPSAGALAQVSASAGVDNGRGSGLYAAFDRLHEAGADRQRRGLDALVGPRLQALPTPEAGFGLASQLIAGARARFPGGLGARYEAIVQPLREGTPLAQQSVGLSYGPACDCWRLEVSAVLRPETRVPDFGASLSLSNFGSFGSAR